ncbi:MAG: lysozyme inhibitor LprI family protein, partial [Pseudomonadota bacterium]
LCVLATPVVALSPSFNCAKASTPTETAICGNAELAMLDLNMANAYRRTLDRLTGGDEEFVRQRQRTWIEERDACGGDETCLTTSYGQVITLLESDLVDLDPPQPLQAPQSARSWGGLLRAGPGLTEASVGSLAVGTEISLLEDTSLTMNGSNWFLIEYSGGTAFQWGGIICAVGRPVVGTNNTCN